MWKKNGGFVYNVFFLIYTVVPRYFGSLDEQRLRPAIQISVQQANLCKADSTKKKSSLYAGN